MPKRNRRPFGKGANHDDYISMTCLVSWLENFRDHEIEVSKGARAKDAAEFSDAVDVISRINDKYPDA